MAKIEFTKAVASGNDFIVLDIFKKNKSFDRQNYSSLSKLLCERKFSIGADGLLVLEPSSKADFKMRIINPDGSEASMCGNGSRCAALYAYVEKIAKKTMSIETLAGNLFVKLENHNIRVNMTQPRDIKKNFKIKLNGHSIKANFINTGVEHVVCFMNSIDNIDVKKLGSAIRYHRIFSPRGTNANFVKVINASTIEVRTYERGVEDETFSCGTGATASAIISALLGKTKPPVNVSTKAKNKLKIYFDLNGQAVKNVFLEGTAKIVYNGKIEI